MRILLLVIPTLVACCSANAVDKCLGAAVTGSGDGSDWSNQGDADTFTFVRGDTYYIADGDYAARLFDTATSGSTIVTIKKATISDHGPATGWSDAFGDGQAIWTAASGVWDVNTTHTIFDGVTGSGFGDTQYGFKIVVTSTSGDAIRSNALIASRVCTNITFQNIEIDLPQVSGTTYAYGFYLTGDVDPNTKSCKNITISNCWIKKGTIAINVGFGRDFVVERCSIEAQGPGDVDNHFAQIIFSLDYSEVTIRYNQIRDAQQVGWTTVIEPQAFPGLNMYIHGNAFYARTGLAYNSFCNEGIFTCAGSVSVDGLFIFNNTIYGWAGGNAGIFLDTGSGVSSNVEIRNNIWVDCDAAGISDPNMVATLSNNDTTATTSTVSFVDAGTYDFRLAAAEGPGTTTAFNTDPNGLTRGSDGTWDRGAFEFEGTPPVFVQAPAGLRWRGR